MISQKFERLLAGHPDSLAPQELHQFQLWCSAQSLSLDQWIDVSLLLYRADPEQCYQYLSYLDRYELSKPAYNDYGHQGAKITIYNNLTGLALAKATRESSREEAEKFMNDARRYLNSSEKVRMTVDKSIILNRAFLHYYGGEVSKALNFVNKTYEETHKTGEGRHLLTTTMLMMAQIHFVKKNYAKSLDLYKRCMEISKGLPTRARLGMGYCFYFLQKYELARACFQRILKLDPTCVEAYVGVAVVCERQENYAQYFDNIKAAYKVDRNHPLVLVHLAEHFLLKGDLTRARQYSEQGIQVIEKFPKFIKAEENCRNDYEEYRARFYNIQGQAYHIANNFTEASRCYTLAVGKGLFHNDMALAQTYLNASSPNYLEAIKLLDDGYRSIEAKDARLLNDSYKIMAYMKSKIPVKKQEDRPPQFYYGQALKYNKQDYEAKIQYAGLLIENNKQKAQKLLEEVEKILTNNGMGAKPELLNNIAVLEMENGELQKCEKRILRCLQQIQQTKPETEEEEVRKSSLLILAKFNYGVCLQKQIKWESARIEYEQIIAINKYHQDSYIRLAYVLYNLGNIRKMNEVLEEGEKITSEVKSKYNRIEKMWNIRAYLQHMSGSSSEAKQTIKQFGKHKEIYTQVFEMCINYENIMRKGVELPVLKEFLRPNREFCYKYCNEDHHAAFAYMLLAIVLLSDKKLTKSQGLEYFNNLKQFSSDDLPSLFYNMGLFLSHYDDHENSTIMFNLYKDKVGCSARSEEIITLNFFLENNYQKCKSILKRSILRDPVNLKSRLMFFYIIQIEFQRYFEKKEFTRQAVETNLRQMMATLAYYLYISKLTFLDIGRGIQVPELKERARNLFMKIKAISEERCFYVKSLIDLFDKKLKDMIQQEKLLKQEQEKKQKEKQLQEEQKKKDRELQQLLGEDVEESVGEEPAAVEEESEDEEIKEMKERERKRQRALQLARQQQEELENNWNELKEKEKYLDEEKKARKRNTNNNNPKPARNKREKKGKEVSEEEMAEEKESEPEAEEYSSEPRKKHKHEKKDKKRKHRDRDRSEEKEEESYSEKEKSDNRRRNDDDDEDDELLNMYKV